MSAGSQWAMLARNVDLFKGLDPDDVGRIFARGVTMIAQKGQTLFYKGTSGEQMYVVMAGTINLLDGDKLIATLKTGDTLGEMALISNEPRSATAVAGEDSKLFVLTETTFQKLMTKRVAIRILLNIIGTLSTRIRESNKHVTRLNAQVKELQG